MGTKTNPGEFDCYNNALPDEPMFILLARDITAPLRVEEWALARAQLINTGVKPESDRALVDEAIDCAKAMRVWRAANDGKWRLKTLSLIAALSLLSAPALAQQTTSDAASTARAVAVSGGGTTIFEASRGRNNTPDVFARQSDGTTDCQFPGFSFGIGQPGLGLSIGVPLGTDADCKHERMARFRMQSAELLRNTDPDEARRNIAAANESLCRVSYNAATAMCAPAPAPQPVTVYYYCRNPAGYYPAVQRCAQPWETVPGGERGR